MVCPRYGCIIFTPIQHPANKKESGVLTTHFDYHSIEGRMTKLDILGHDDPTIIRMLEDLTGIDAKTIPFDDPKTLSLFLLYRGIGLTPEQLQGDQVASLRSRMWYEVCTGHVEDSCPQTFSDLVRISGFSHGTNVWLDNAQDLIKNGTCKLNEAISTRDDVMNFLIHRGMDRKHSFFVMENVRKGKGIENEINKVKLQRNLKQKCAKIIFPEWFIESCKRFPIYSQGPCGSLCNDGLPYCLV